MNLTVLEIREMELTHQRRRECGQQLAIEVIETGSKKQYDDGEPPQRDPHQGNSTTATSPTVPIFASALALCTTLILRGGRCTPQPNTASGEPWTAICFGSRTSRRTMPFFRTPSI